MSTASWRKRFRLLFVPLTLAALVWAVALLWDAWPQLRTNLPRLQAGWLWLTLVGNLVAGYLGFEAFRMLFNRMRPNLYGRMDLGHLYFTAQLMKHLPGRIWGVAYQSATGDRATLAEWVSVNVAFMLLSTIFALWVAGIVLCLAFGWQWGLLVFVLGAAAYGLGWREHVLMVLVDLLRRLPAWAIGRICDALQPLVNAGVRFKLLIWCLLAANWLLVLLAWAGYGVAWPDLAAVDGIWLCAIYTVAWFVGYISLFSPSGIGVRELVFVLLAHQFPPDAVAGTVVLGRVMLLLVDVIFSLLFAPSHGSQKLRRL